MAGDSYFTGDLPPYFKFEPLLNEIDTKLGNHLLSDFYKNGLRPQNFSDTNYKLITNKDGNLAWRQLCLIHPALYVDLVNLICKPDNWGFIRKRFAKFRADKRICCASIPVFATRKTQKANQVLTWVSKVEKDSIKKSFFLIYYRYYGLLFFYLYAFNCLGFTWRIFF